MKIIVVGAGFGGIAAALRMRAKGHEVTLIDKMPLLGGRAQVLEHDGIQFDAGPTVITAPFLFDELFALFNKNRSDYIEFLPVKPWYRFYFSDGQQLDYGSNLEETLENIDKFAPGESKNYLKMLDQAKVCYDIGFTKLGDYPFESIGSMLRILPDLLKLRGYLSVYQLVGHFLKNQKLRQAFSIHPLLVGGNPLTTSAIYTLIHYLEQHWGVWFAKGGTGALVKVLGKLMLEEGIDIKLNSTVEQISVDKGKTQGVIMNGEYLAADQVIVNGDPPYTYQNLIKTEQRKIWSDHRIGQLHYSMGLFVMYFTTNKKYAELPHHAIFLSDNFVPLLKDIFRHRTLNYNFSYYLHRPATTDADFIQKDQDTFYVLVPVPNLKAHIQWQKEGPILRDAIIHRLQETTMPDLKSHLVNDFYWTPEDFQNNYLSLWGTGFSIAPLLTQSAYFRFHNQAKDINGLYFVGAGTHPGAGLPGVVTSAKVLEHYF